MELVLQTEKEITRTFYDDMMSDFPKDELKPLKQILNLHHTGQYFCYGGYQENDCLAYAYFVRNPKGNMKLLDYLAVTEKMRGKGVGKEFLETVLRKEAQQSYIMLEVEDPERADTKAERSIREGRIEFYKKCGIFMTSVRTEAMSVPYCIMGTRPDMDEEQIKKEYLEMYDFMFGVSCNRRVCIREDI